LKRVLKRGAEAATLNPTQQDGIPSALLTLKITNILILLQIVSDADCGETCARYSPLQHRSPTDVLHGVYKAPFSPFTGARSRISSISTVEALKFWDDAATTIVPRAWAPHGFLTKAPRKGLGASFVCMYVYTRFYPRIGLHLIYENRYTFSLPFR